MTAPVQLRELLEHVLAGAPDDAALGDEVDAVFRRADRLRRRRTRALVAAGTATVAAIAAAGYLLTTTLLPSHTAAPAPAPAPSPSAVPVPSAIADDVLAIVAPMIDRKKLRIVPRPPGRGDGWRQYSVSGSDGGPRGTVEVAVYSAPDGFCFPVPDKQNDSDTCAKAKSGGNDIMFVRYDDRDDVDWQVSETIARRERDGRTIAVMATGERGTGDESRGRPALTGTQVEDLATDPRLMDAFDPGEGCDGTESGDCPVFRVPVPAE